MPLPPKRVCLHKGGHYEQRKQQTKNKCKEKTSAHPVRRPAKDIVRRPMKHKMNKKAGVKGTEEKEHECYKK